MRNSTAEEVFSLLIHRPALYKQPSKGAGNPGSRGPISQRLLTAMESTIITSNGPYDLLRPG